MKGRNRSIRDFFTPKSPQVTPPLQDTSSTRRIPVSLSRTSSLQRDSTPLSQNTRAAPSTVPPAPIRTTSTSPDAQPPTTSQTSVNSGASKRVISNGEQMVLNSDSDDSLPELDWGGLTANVKIVAPPTRSKRTAEIDDDGLRRPERGAKSKKRPFDQVIETAQRNKELERIISERKAALDKHVEEAPVAEFTFDEDALGQAVQDDEDPDKAHRLFLAMQRTNATQAETVFHFFHDSSGSLISKSSFPVDSLPKQRWTLGFRDASSRDQAFLTGFAAQVFRLQELPEELASWMIDQICLNRSEALDSKYLEILEAHDHYLRTLLSRERLDVVFKTIGGNLESLCSDAQVAPSFDIHSANPPLLPRSLKSVARLLSKAAPWLGVKARSHAFHILCLACIDDRVLSEPDILETLQEAIEATVCHFVDNQKLIRGLSDVLPRLLSHITHPILQRNLVCAMPAESPLTAYFRRHLALSLLLHPHTVDIPLADPQIPSLVHKHLQTSPHFRVNKETNYNFLAARMTLLDIAIGPGPLSVPYQPLVSPAPSQAGSSPIMAPLPASDEIKDFNREVDALAQHIKMLGNSIVEAGAVTDLTILDAKDCVERLCARLEHAVRIGGKKSHNVFGNDDDEKQLKVTDHFRRVAKARRTAPPRGIFDNDEDADDDQAVAAQIEAETSF